MTTTTWTRSGVYGSSVLLGPTQAAVYRFVVSVTDGDRRPAYSLREISERVGKPVSSVHEALGRLRALGLIGCMASMGRTGKTRLWRVGARVSSLGALDLARHSRAIARIWKRWGGVISGPRPIYAIEAKSEPLFADDKGRPAISPSLADPGSSFDELVRQGGNRLPWDPPEDTTDAAQDSHRDSRYRDDAAEGTRPARAIEYPAIG